MGYVSKTSGGSVGNQGQNTSYEIYYSALKVLGRTGAGCIYIIDLKNEKLEFISENPSLFAGLNSKEVEKMGYRFFRKHARAEDLKILKAVNTAGFKFFECLTPEEKKQNTIAYDFHLKSASTVDVLVNHKITPIEVSEEGDVSKMVCVASYALSKTAGNICISSNTSDVYWCYNLDTEKWSEQHKITLKPREIEIIRLYLQGLKIEEIAQQLFVSPTTVKFHRSKLFEKIGVSNITEAISYVMSNNLM